MAPSNSEPRPILTVVGENAFQTIDSTDVGGDEEIDAWAETVSFLEEFIQENNHELK